MKKDAYARAHETRTVDGELCDLPKFEFGYGLDDRYHPSEVTIFDDSAGTAVLESWLTIDLDHAVPLEEVA